LNNLETKDCFVNDVIIQWSNCNWSRGKIKNWFSLIRDSIVKFQKFRGQVENSHFYIQTAPFWTTVHRLLHLQTRDRFNKKPKPFWATSHMNVSSTAHYLLKATLNNPAIAGLLFPCFFSKKQRRSCLMIVGHEHMNRGHHMAL
jgi:hypothetical protein